MSRLARIPPFPPNMKKASLCASFFFVRSKNAGKSGHSQVILKNNTCQFCDEGDTPR